MKQKIYNLIVLDASGSMYSIRNEAIAGVVETVQTIRTAQADNADQEQLFSLVVFNGARIATVYDRMPISKVPDFNEKDYQTTDNTPLYDAMGDAITNLQRYIDENDNALVTIITDGYENASVEWNHQRITQLVDDLKKKNWLFTYIGANQDAIEVAKTMNIKNALNFVQDEAGTRRMFEKERRSRGRFMDVMHSAFCCYAPSSKEAQELRRNLADSDNFFADDDDKA
jgi:Mg-chelatase subunit ChlD